MLRTTLSLASQQNRKSRYTLNIVNDLTTVIHIGDLFELTWFPDKDKSWRIVELKSGRMNETLSGMLGERSTPLTDEEEADIEKALGSHAMKQARRIIRQRDELQEFRNIVETNRGRDFGTKQNIILPPTTEVVEDFEEIMAELVEKAATEGIAATCIDECLRLVAAQETVAASEHQILMPFFMMTFPKVLTGEWSAEEVKNQIQNLGTPSPIINLVDLSMTTQCGKSVFMWTAVPQSRQIDLVLGRIKVFAQFDVQAFLRRAGTKGIMMSWLHGQESNSLKDISAVIPGSPNSRGVKTIFPDGKEIVHMNGFFSRPFLYLTTPDELLRLSRKGVDDVENAHNKTSLSDVQDELSPH